MFRRCALASGEKVFLPLRLSFIVPANLVLDTLMMSGACAVRAVLCAWSGTH